MAAGKTTLVMAPLWALTGEACCLDCQLASSRYQLAPSERPIWQSCHAVALPLLLRLIFQVLDKVLLACIPACRLQRACLQV